ncbi:hypothetical protein Gotur_024277 [Gossypium turneri]
MPEAQKFRTSGIDPEFEGKLDQMFMGIVATGDKAWTPSSEMMFTFQMMFKLMEKVKKEQTLRYKVYILKLKERNPQNKLEGLQDCPVK